METIFTIGAFIITIVSLVLGYIERKDMIDRLMSKNIVEYKSLKEEKNDFGEDNQNLINILDAKQELMNENE